MPQTYEPQHIATEIIAGELRSQGIGHELRFHSVSPSVDVIETISGIYIAIYPDAIYVAVNGHISRDPLPDLVDPKSDPGTWVRSLISRILECKTIARKRFV